ncbi:hypothetical protein BH18VER1_BH18VER1_07660 [soil metagenome]
MAGSADFIQRMVHTLEAGGLAVWVRRALALAVVLGIALFYLLHEFRGLATSQAMDQAQIGRNIAAGQGWRTDIVRPLAVGQLQAHDKNVAQRIWFDTYHAPLPPLVDAVALRVIKSKWKMTPRDVIYLGDRVIAFTSICLFLAALVVCYFTARRLFDARLALLATSLVLLCDMMWQYSLSGLPQMLLLFLFNCAMYALVRTVQAQDDGGRVGVWLAAVGGCFGLLALSHALTIWIFIPLLICSVFMFRPRGRAALIVLVAFSALYLPWLARNYVISGNPGGVAIYSVLDGINRSEAGHMRRLQPDLKDVGPGHFRNKIMGNIISQADSMFRYLGWSIVASVFFVGLLYAYRRHDTAIIRWIVLAMWSGAFLGMAAYGITEEQGVASNQLHLLFVPMMTCYGLAFLLVQWNRLEIESRLARIAFLTLLFLLCSWPMVNNFFAPRKARVQWPPYVPPYISVLNDWMKPEELIASDMPWAISWYADRRSLYLPETVKAMTDFHDYGLAGAPVNGLYLTPISGSQNKLADVLKGEYKDWAGVILRSVDLQKFPLPWATLLGLENECIFFSDHDRQKVPTP